MTDYMLIESRDPFEFRDVPRTCTLAADLVSEGHDVTLFLVENGVLSARAGADAPGLTEAAGRGVTVLADAYSLKERGIDTARLSDAVSAAPLDVVVDGLAAGAKTLWH